MGFGGDTFGGGGGGDMFGFGSMAQAGAALGTGVLGYFGQQSANQTNIDIARDVNAMNQANAREAMAFSERMANTQYQRGVADMRAAGINPMLAIMNGGAAAPQGTASSGVAAKVDSPIGAGISSAVDAMKTMTQMSQAKSQNALNDAYIDVANRDAELKTNSAKQADANTKILNAQLGAVKAQAKLDKKNAEINTNMAEYDHVANRVKREMGTVVNAIGGLPKALIGGGEGKYTEMDLLNAAKGKGVLKP